MIGNPKLYTNSSDLTIFAVPKPFVGHIGIIQRNAIMSWSLLIPRPEIILIGNEPGISELSIELGLKHIPHVERNEFGTPLISSIFNLAETNSATDWLAYLNSDCILLDDFPKSLALLKNGLGKLNIADFLLHSQRIELDVKDLLPFKKPDWQNILRHELDSKGVKDYKAAVELMLYNRGLFSDIPPFAIGRPVWDHWMVWKAQNRGAAIIDAAGAFTLIHQCHDYSHVSGGYQQAWKGVETERNALLAGDHRLNLTHKSNAFTHILDKNGLKHGHLQEQTSNAAILNRRIKRAIEEFNSGNYSAALDYLNDTASRSGGGKGLRSLNFYQALCLFHMERYEEAEADLLKELEAFPGNIEASNLLARLKEKRDLLKAQERKKTGIIVFGYNRPLHLKNLLESLRRQNTTHDIHVWLDGHHHRPQIMDAVKRCKDIVQDEFPKAYLTAMNGNLGIEKVMIDGLSFMSSIYDRIIVLEDDCFPTSDAIAEFEQALDEIETRPEVYSAYGHHFLTASEGETITRFQGWGWATTKEKLLPVLEEMKRCFAMPEPDYLRWVRQNLTPEVVKRLDVTPGRNCVPVIASFFCWDGCTCLITAMQGLVHKKTKRRVIFNCGMGGGSTHFQHDDKFRLPPFNMIPVEEVWNYYDSVKRQTVPQQHEGGSTASSRISSDKSGILHNGEIVVDGLTFTNVKRTESQNTSVGFNDKYIIKIEHERHPDKLRDLEEEVEVIKHLNSRECVSCPKLFSAGKLKNGERYLIQERVHSRRGFNTADMMFSILEQKSLGVCQGDLKKENFVFDSYSLCHIIDYDQAIMDERFVSMGNTEYMEWFAQYFVDRWGQKYTSITDYYKFCGYDKVEIFSLFKDDSFNLASATLFKEQATTDTKCGIYHSFKSKEVFIQGARDLNPRLDSLNTIEFKRAEKVLDVGCNMGLLGHYLHDRGCRVTGIDMDGKIVIAAKMVANILHKNIQFKWLDLDSGRIEEDYDTICLFSVIHHAKNFKQATENIAQRCNRIILECSLNERGSKYVGGKWADTTKWKFDSLQELVNYLETVFKRFKFYQAHGSADRDRYIISFVKQSTIQADISPSSGFPDKFPNFTYSKKTHFEYFKRYAFELYKQQVDPYCCDLKRYQDLLVFSFIKEAIPEGSRILEIGGGESRILKHFKSKHECWNLDKLEGLGNGPAGIEPNGYRLIKDYIGYFNKELPDNYFDFVFSISALEHIPDNDPVFLTNIKDDIMRVLKPGGYSLHCFDIVLKDDSAWINNLLPFLFKNIKTINSFIPAEELRKDTDLYFMSENAYDKGWHSYTNKSYAEFGKPLSYNILWRKEVSEDSHANTKDLSEPVVTKAAQKIENITNLKKTTRYNSGLTNTIPKISIVTPSFNQGQFLEECINSILSQNYPNLEYIIMDGSSTDNSVQIIKKYEKHLTYWQSRPDGGQYAAINEGFKKSSGEIMCWLNSDDKLHPDSLFHIAYVFTFFKNVQWIMGRPTSWRSDGFLDSIRDPLPLWSRSRYLSRDYKYIQQESTFWRRSLWEKSGSYVSTDFNYAGDMELWSRFFRFAELYSVDLCLGGFRTHPDQKTAAMLHEYEREADLILDRETDFFNMSNAPFSPPPEPIRLSRTCPAMDEFKRKCLKEISPGGGRISNDSVKKMFGDLNRQGQELLAGGDTEGSIKALIKALEIDPNNAITNYNIGVIYYQLGNREKALSYYEKAVRLAPDNIVFQQNMADFYYFVFGCVTEAVSIYMKIGQTHVSMKQHDAAVNFFVNVLNMYPASTEARNALLNMVDIFKTAGEVSKAQNVCLFLLHRYPDDKEATLAWRDLTDNRENHQISDKLLQTIAARKFPFKVSAVISTFNSEKFIRGCLENLVDQTLYKKGELEIIVVDSCSQENEREIVEEFQKKHANIVYIHTEERETIYAAWNRGINASTGKFLTSANTDDRHRIDALEIMARELETHPDVSLVYADQIYTNIPHETFETTKSTKLRVWSEYSYQTLRSHCMVSSQPMWRRSLHDHYGQFDESYASAGDWEFWLRIGREETFKKINHVLGLYYENPDGVENSNPLSEPEAMRVRHHYGIAPHEQHYSTFAIYTPEKNNLSREAVASPRVSVIIPCYNQAQYLPEAVESVVNQTYINWECIIVNDGSPDNTSEVAREFIAKYPDKKIVLLEKKNSGPSDTRNYGIRNSKGKYILPLDSDDLLHPEMLKKTVCLLESHPDISIAYTGMEEFGYRSGFHYPSRFNIEKLRYQNFIYYCSLYRREAWETVGGYNTNMVSGYEDWDFWIACAEKGLRAEGIPDPLLKYRVKEKSRDTQAVKHDAELKAQIVFNHPGIYSREAIAMAEKTLGKKLVYQHGPLVSVIVPTYNRPEMLVETLKSILNQTYKHIEIIVVNDAGRDVEGLVQGMNQDNNIRYIIHPENKGLAASRNTGIKAANGKYIAYLDDDDIYYPEHIETLVNYLEVNDFKVAYTDAFRANQEMRDGRYVTVQKEEQKLPDFDYEHILTGNFIPVLCIMHEKSCLDQVGMFDETLVGGHEDWDLWIRMSREFKFAHIKKSTCEVSWRLDSSHFAFRKDKFNETFQIVSKRGRKYLESQKKDKYAAHYVMYLDDFFLDDSIESVYPYVDKILIARTTKPWFGSSVDLREAEEALERVMDRFGDKIEVFIDEFPNEQTQRNFLIKISKEQGHKGAFIVDCDEVFIGDVFNKLYDFIKRNNPDSLQIQHHTFIKDASFCIAPPYEDKLFYINLSCNPEFLWARSCNLNKTLLKWDDPQILHFSYLRKTDEDILKKIKSFMHAQDADWDKWYQAVYLNFNPGLKNFHPVNPEMWRGVSPFNPDKFPENLLLKLQRYNKLSYLQPKKANHLPSKLTLPSTTLCCIDCCNHGLSIRALEHSMSQCGVDRVAFFTDKDFNLSGIDVIRIPTISTKEQYSRFVIKELNKYINTDFALMIQYDGFIINPDAWTKEFLKYDYIGAKWQWYNDGFRVGNGGFSLRSKRLMLALSDESIQTNSVEYGEDTLICRTYRSFLEDKYGIKFAPEILADRFSYERSGFTGNHPFGFHGLFNMWRYITPEYLPDLINNLSPKTLGSIEALELGINYHNAGQLKEAETVYRKILEFHPDHQEALSKLKMISHPAYQTTKTGRNDPCPCGSGRKYKKCCGGEGKGIGHRV